MIPVRPTILLFQDADGVEELSMMCKTSLPAAAADGINTLMFAAEVLAYNKLFPAMENVAGLCQPLPWPR